jgi:hypothetical protein
LRALEARAALVEGGLVADAKAPLVLRENPLGIVERGKPPERDMPVGVQDVRAHLGLLFAEHCELVCRAPRLALGNEGVGDLFGNASAKREEACEHAQARAPRTNEHFAVDAARERALGLPGDVGRRQRACDEPAARSARCILLGVVERLEPAVALVDRKRRQRLVDTQIRGPDHGAIVNRTPSNLVTRRAVRSRPTQWSVPKGAKRP